MNAAEAFAEHQSHVYELEALAQLLDGAEDAPPGAQLLARIAGRLCESLDVLQQAMNAPREGT